MGRVAPPNIEEETDYMTAAITTKTRDAMVFYNHLSFCLHYSVAFALVTRRNQQGRG